MRPTTLSVRYGVGPPAMSGSFDNRTGLGCSLPMQLSARPGCGRLREGSTQANNLLVRVFPRQFFVFVSIPQFSCEVCLLKATSSPRNCRPRRQFRARRGAMKWSFPAESRLKSTMAMGPGCRVSKTLGAEMKHPWASDSVVNHGKIGKALDRRNRCEP